LPGVFANIEEEAARIEEEIKRLNEQIAEREKKMDALKDDMNSQQEYIEQVQDQIETVQKKVDALQSKVNVLRREIASLDAQIASLDAEIVSMNAEIEAINGQIGEQEKAIEDAYVLLGERLCALYMAGENSDLELLLSSGSLESFLTRAELFSDVAEHDNQLVADIRSQIDNLNKMISDLNTKKQTVELKRIEVEAAKLEVQERKSVQDAALAEVQKEENAIQRDLDKLLKYMSSLKSTSEQYQKLNDRAEAAINAKEQEIAALLKGESSTGDGNVSGMLWPVPYNRTYISSPYGMRTLNGKTKMHYGIDICVSGGTLGKKIIAPADGVVRTAITGGYNGGAGTYTVIDHGDGLLTYYYHCNSLNVSKGQNVKKGDTIAYIGSTGYSTGPHLHFAITVNGTYINPLTKVPKPSDCVVY
ncbi:MAG: peptidoglycan DD-metalloendopeptidase family protein, partial [Clostridiales bacterium]|nr:peptidoglycan DD-metalloendopeptidase family protein [Clostridiales bacterium]